MLGGLEKTVKTENIRFVNRRPGLTATIEKLLSVGSSWNGTIAKAKQILAVGTNIQYDAALGDSVTVERSEGVSDRVDRFPRRRQRTSAHPRKVPCPGTQPAKPGRNVQAALL